jgi:hypothetical protein
MHIEVSFANGGAFYGGILGPYKVGSDECLCLAVDLIVVAENRLFQFAYETTNIHGVVAAKRHRISISSAVESVHSNRTNKHLNLCSWHLFSQGFTCLEATTRRVASEGFVVVAIDLVSGSGNHLEIEIDTCRYHLSTPTQRRHTVYRQPSSYNTDTLIWELHTKPHCLA